MSEPDDVQRRFVRAREMIGRGKQALSEGHRMLRQLSGDVRNARSRGMLHQLIWDCEKLGDQRTGYFSQSGQDAFLDEAVFKGKRGGVFVEVGGYNGLSGSNCLFFEMMRGWSGILVEASPRYHAKAAEFRRCPCLNFAVAGEAGEAEFLEIEDGMRQMGGLVTTYEPQLLKLVEADPRHKAKTIKVKTRTLAQILDTHHLKEIDYVSLDIEGAELEVLQSFPFETYRVHVWTVENPMANPEIPKLMRDKGYKRVDAMGADDVYVLAPEKDKAA